MKTLPSRPNKRALLLARGPNALSSAFCATTFGSTLVARLMWGHGVAVALLLSACQAEKPHEKTFFACATDRLECPAEQFCNTIDLCCHANSDGPNDNLGHCKVLSEGSSSFPSSGSTSTGAPQ